MRLELWVERVGGARFTINYEMFDASVLVARASTMCVTFDFDAGRPRRLTDEERAALGEYADGPA